ncbi:MAG: hypothetical protein K0V04_34745 [Deltaproteobacteria bacterium]|nr:hypothetical protein [Deltaproteobacteria bacterium]
MRRNALLLLLGAASVGFVACDTEPQDDLGDLDREDADECPVGAAGVLHQGGLVNGTIKKGAASLIPEMNMHDDMSIERKALAMDHDGAYHAYHLEGRTLHQSTGRPSGARRGTIFKSPTRSVAAASMVSR